MQRFPPLTPEAREPNIPIVEFSATAPSESPTTQVDEDPPMIEELAAADSLPLEQSSRDGSLMTAFSPSIYEQYERIASAAPFAESQSVESQSVESRPPAAESRPPSRVRQCRRAFARRSAGRQSTP